MNNSIKQILEAGALNWPECASSTSPALLRLLRVSDIFQNSAQKHVENYNLQRADFGVLCTLRRSPAPHCLSPTALYQSMLFSSGGLTKVLGRLSRIDLIERLDNPEDKRSKLVQLTTQGKTLVERMLPELHLHEQRILEVLNKDEQQQLNSLLERILLPYE
ncbi:MarR family winged helix-turn-helix transcriptional regulator [Psychromonas aquimarina]|uniref:MarR family winged helix-turn-helix transcriptional regulator n=1 Tax=Psychromonas aquimarina TaxID=444919 RepID=UPI0004082FEC|nr:MarR family transcriptional regulator [Psychromonas aquimarina]